MRTEDYIIIIISALIQNGKFEVLYNSNVYEGNLSLRISSQTGRVIHTAENLKGGERIKVNFDAEGLAPGTYICEIFIDGTLMDSKTVKLF